jgi:hypothetical protein
MNWSGCSKEAMARAYGAAMEQRSGELDATLSAHLRQLDLATLAQRAKARAEGRGGWACIGVQRLEAAPPAPTTAEIAAAVFKALVPAALRQEVHEVSRSLLRAEDRLRAAEQRLKAVQEHNAALLAQAAVAGGISVHELTRPGGRLEWAQRVLAVQVAA